MNALELLPISEGWEWAALPEAAQIQVADFSTVFLLAIFQALHTGDLDSPPPPFQRKGSRLPLPIALLWI